MIETLAIGAASLSLAAWIYLIFFSSEVIIGIIPPEFIMKMFTVDTELGQYTMRLLWLSLISYLGQSFQYFRNVLIFISESVPKVGEIVIHLGNLGLWQP